MRWWEIRAALHGNERKDRITWETTRWLGFIQAVTQGAKIKKPSDLLELPWEKGDEEEYSDEDIEHLEELLRQENEKGKV